MEAADVWHLPVVDEGRVIGVVSKENLLRLLGRGFGRRSKIARPA
jgi:CBS domain-containing protein